MRKWIRLQKKMLIKNMAFLVMLCMVIGSVYFPVFAQEENGNKPSAAESGDSASEDLENKDLENKEESPEAPKGDAEKEDSTEGEKEPEPDDNKDEKEPDSDGELNEEEPEEEPKEDNNENPSDNDIEIEEPEEEKENDEKQEIPEIINVVVPATYLLALNPYSLPIKIAEDTITTAQVISGNYGIVNKSSTDQIVRVSLTVEDRNDGELVFVDSAEEAMNAEEGVYAVYLAVVPADEEEILADGSPIDESVTGETLQNVEMSGEQAVALHAGNNEIAFKLSGAVYRLEETASDNPEDESMESEEGSENEFEMILDGLAPNGTGVTAYTFYGVMNPNAAWQNLSGGIKLSVVYTYQTADGNEEIIEGTGAMVSVD